MKAICLLLCLALAQGHIFRRQSTPNVMDRLVIKSLNYVDQQPLQQQEQEQRAESYSGRSWELYDQSEQSQQSQKVGNQHRRSPQYRPRYQQGGQPRPTNYEQQNQQNEWSNQQQISQQQRLKSKQASDSTSNESNSKETMKNMNNVALYSDVLNAHLSTYSAQDDLSAPRSPRYSPEQKPVYGDVISWKGVKFAESRINPVNKEVIEKTFGNAYNNMKHVSESDKKIFHNALETATKNLNEDALLNATQLLNKYQYEVEEHTIKTDDGYLLTVFRILPKTQTSVQKSVVFLMHGLLGSADDWLLMGPGKSLAYLLADAGHEVWLGNARGSKYSRHHVSKHPAQSDFWQFSTDEIALHDLPAMIDYVLKTSNQNKIQYVGYSEGNTAFFALAASRPEYNDKIIMMHALAPMVYMTNVRSPMIRMIAPNSPFYSNLHRQLGHGQFTPTKELVHTIGGSLCENEIGCKNICSNAAFVMAGVNMDNLDVEKIPVILRHIPVGASTRQIKQYAQGVASHEFTKYDFGAEVNEKVYGKRQPPQYDMTKVIAPVALYYSERDWLAAPADVERLARELPQVVAQHKMADDQFSHMDFHYGKNAPEVVYSKLIESIEQ